MLKRERIAYKEGYKDGLRWATLFVAICVVVCISISVAIMVIYEKTMLFKDHVLKTVRQHGTVTMQPEGSIVNFLSCYHGHWKAFCVKAHGRLSKHRLEDLEDYQRNTGTTVILVSEQADHVPRFEALNRHLKWRERIKERYKKE